MIELPAELKEPIMYTLAEVRMVEALLSVLKDHGFKIKRTNCLGEKDGQIYIQLNTLHLRPGEALLILCDNPELLQDLNASVKRNVTAVYTKFDGFWLIVGAPIP